MIKLTNESGGDIECEKNYPDGNQTITAGFNCACKKMKKELFILKNLQKEGHLKLK